MNAQKIMRQIKDHLYRSAPKIGSKCVSKPEKAYLISEQRVFWNLIVAVGLVNEKKRARNDKCATEGEEWGGERQAKGVSVSIWPLRAILCLKKGKTKKAE